MPDSAWIHQKYVAGYLKCSQRDYIYQLLQKNHYNWEAGPAPWNTVPIYEAVLSWASPFFTGSKQHKTQANRPEPDVKQVKETSMKSN